MKVLVLINSAPRYKLFYSNLADALERVGCEVFFAVDARRSAVLEPLDKVDKGAGTYFFDDFFKKNYAESSFEGGDNVTWGEAFFSDFDRFLSHGFNLEKPPEYWKRVKHCLDAFFDNLVRDESIDFVLYENVSNSFAYSAFRSARRNGIKYIGLMASRIPGRFEIQTSVIDDETRKISDMVGEDATQEENEWYETYRKSILNTSPDYMSYNNLGNVDLSRLLAKDKLRYVCRLVKAHFSTDSFYDYQFGKPLGAIFKGMKVNVKRKINFFFERRFFCSNEEIERLSLEEEFFVYPIHFHPESSTSVLAPEYTDEFNNVLNIANNLPFGVMLYVKEHKSAIGVQAPSVYKKISALPNVRFVDPSYNIKDLIVKSKGLITVNSTAGFEAAVLGKPVNLLGRVFYEDFPNVNKLKGFSDIKNISSGQDDVDCRQHVVAYYRYTHEGHLRIDKSAELDQHVYDDFASKVMDVVNA
ncbi:hypothetical protein [Halomonas salina]|uniref:capsular polysaccharide export protein, LipB/KpsS family n=1 Tax=Halomonas salina TaxID=42565 RepID=UPI0009DEE107|nr:hypothetical protein [Halomonas salina]